MPHPKPSQDLLSPSEWRIFWVLSRHHPLTIAEIGQELSRLDPPLSLNDNTVRTFVKRLQNKSYLKEEAGSALLSFRPTVPFEVALRFHVDRFLEQFALGGEGDLEILRQVVEERLSDPLMSAETERARKRDWRHQKQRIQAEK